MFIDIKLYFACRNHQICSNSLYWFIVLILKPILQWLFFSRFLFLQRHTKHLLRIRRQFAYYDARGISVESNCVSNISCKTIKQHLNIYWSLQYNSFVTKFFFRQKNIWDRVNYMLCKSLIQTNCDTLHSERTEQILLYESYTHRHM